MCSLLGSHCHVVRSSIKSQENNNRKDDIIETIQKNPSTIIQKKKLDIIDKDIEKVRDFERQKANNPKEILRKEFSTEKDIDKDRQRQRKKHDKEGERKRKWWLNKGSQQRKKR